MQNIKLLKQILSIPTQTGNEKLLVEYLCNYLKYKSIPFELDDMGNIIATKGSSKHYPCVLAHTDTVHDIKNWIDIREVRRRNAQGEDKAALAGYITDTDIPIGCGGDDKAGVFICLQLLDHFENIKVFFPVSEENGCVGTKATPKQWFKDVGYFIQFDSPENNTMSATLGGRTLCFSDEEFWNLSKGIIAEHGITEHQHHPYTDVGELKRRFEVECLNLATGYYNLHTYYEYVVLEDVENAIQLGKKLIKTLGCKKYKYKSKLFYIGHMFLKKGKDNIKHNKKAKNNTKPNHK